MKCGTGTVGGLRSAQNRDNSLIEDKFLSPSVPTVSVLVSSFISIPIDPHKTL